ncbi:hypothetical protein ACFYNY_32710 [Streptomyces sp. NPDC006530]|uniref:hypothetical protein n=1 Tax=Streptomyces sp. NPDC006530 TaxID=3364750 RepID=UPI0036A5AA11
MSDISTDLTLEGSGTATISAGHRPPTGQAEAVNWVTVTLRTDCLRNANWHR